MARNSESTERSGRDDRPSPRAGRGARRRRLVIEELLDRQCPTTVDELAASIADEEGIPGESTDYERLRTTLHHVDLPALDDAGFLTYDPGRNTATPTVERLQRRR